MVVVAAAAVVVVAVVLTVYQHLAQIQIFVIYDRVSRTHFQKSVCHVPVGLASSYRAHVQT